MDFKFLDNFVKNDIKNGGSSYNKNFFLDKNEKDDKLVTKYT